MKPLQEQRLLFVTGRLAEHSLREVVLPLSERLGFRFEIIVPGIQVAALLNTQLLLKRLVVPPETDQIILPGWCQGNVQELSEKFGCPVHLGPKDLRDLPEYFGLGKRPPTSLDRYSIEIIGEINHATRLPLSELLNQSNLMRASGADVIDVGCIPGESSPRITEIVRALRSDGFRVSIDSFDRSEVESAVNAGAELILSCNHSNVHWLSELGTEVVAIPDQPSDFNSLRTLVDQLQAAKIPFRLDPIIEPIGMGFTASLGRYLQTRQDFPDLPIMMGIGNVTELSEVDSAGVNLVLAAICEELGIQSVLTTQVIPWCRTAIAEFDAARRLVWYSIANRVIPKHLSSALVMLRDPKWAGRTNESLQQLASAITDPNFRIFAENGQLHVMNRFGYYQGNDPFLLFQQVLDQRSNSIDSGHAFYLGYELARAELALLLGKQYEQDAPMRWGLIGPWRPSSSVHEPSGKDNPAAEPASDEPLPSDSGDALNS